MEGITAKKVSAAALAAALAVGTGPMAAFAATPEGTAGTPTGSGQTELNVKIKDAGETSESNDNLTFTVPSSINFVVEADGTLYGPSAAAAAIDNDSRYGAYVSAMQVTGVGDWNIVQDADTADNAVRNAISVNIGPSGAMKSIAQGNPNGATAGSKVAITEHDWDMKADKTADDGDKVKLDTNGKINNVDVAITEDTKFATIEWYVTGGKRA